MLFHPFYYLILNGMTKLFISVALIVLGAFVAGARDLSFDAYGYGMVFIANMTTAIYLATINRVGSIHILTIGLSCFLALSSSLSLLSVFQENQVVSTALVSCGVMVIIQGHNQFGTFN